jgi:hypothetical protein
MTRLALLLLVAGPAAADDHFETRVRPVLADRCFGCHSAAAGKSKGGLTLDTAAGVRAGGDGGPDPGLILKAVRGDDPDVAAMPPAGPRLTPQQVADLAKWVADGANFPEPAKPPPAAPHWAYQPVRNPPVPPADGWSITPADPFLFARMKSAGLEPAADADPGVVARRLSFALVGLPPTVEDADRVRAGGWIELEKYADRLLASSHFGERWGRHWLDVVRYADGTGNEYDYEIEGAWRYRDAVVRAFNADLPFDRFVRDHIAGDLTPRVAGGRDEALLLTGWWHLHEAATAPVDLPADEADRLDNQLDTLGKAFNALTVGCARCHDHKFDPIRTREYYGLFGIAAATPMRRAWANAPALDAAAAGLRSLRPDPPGLPTVSVPPLRVSGTVLGDFAAGVPTGWRVFGPAEVVTGESAAARQRQPGLWSNTLSRRLPSLVQSPTFVIDKDHLDVLVAGRDSTVQVVVSNHQLVRDPIYDGLRKRVTADGYRWVRFNVGRWKGRRAHVEVFTGTVEGQVRILHTRDTPANRFGLRAVAHADGELPPVPTPVALPARPPGSATAAWNAARIEACIPTPERFLAVAEADGTDRPVYHRGDAAKPRGEPQPRQYLGVCGGAKPASGSGRRELADALVSPTNPLTARVFVNRVWHHLFGRGLVPTVDNFGRLGEPPSHPELLDFLAHRFVRVHGWRVKPLVRELVLSRAFRLAGGKPPAADPTNALLSRHPLRRLDAEAVRDAVLAAAGTPDPTVGGPPVPVPHDLHGALTDSDNVPPSGPADGNRRRSLYLAQRRNYPSRFLRAFDQPPALGPVGRRDVTTSPSQALALRNDPFVVGQATGWAARGEPVAGLFAAALGRPPAADELAGLSDLSPADAALTLFGLAEFTHVP